jgi:hypothetical protein
VRKALKSGDDICSSGAEGAQTLNGLFSADQVEELRGRMEAK